MILTSICLITPNVPVLSDFYSIVLGAKNEGNEVHAELRTDGIRMEIFSSNGMEQMAPNSMNGAGYGSFTINFKVDDVDAEYERLQAMNVVFVKSPKTNPWGARSVWFRDPDGNIVNFYSEVHSN